MVSRGSVSTFAVRALGRARRLRDAMRIARSGLVDVEYYEAVTGLTFPTPLAVAHHYLSASHRAELSLHPLFEPEFLLPKAEPDADPVGQYLTDRKLFGKKSPHPLFDLRVAKRSLKEAGISYQDGAWLTWVRNATPTTKVPVAEGTPPVAWGKLRTQIIRSAREWRAASADSGTIDWAQVESARSDDLISVLIPIAGDLSNALARLVLLKGDPPAELVCTGFVSRAQFCTFTALAEVRPLRVVRSPGVELARQWNLGASASRGDRLVFVAPHARINASDIRAVAAALDDPGTVIAQPLNETPEMTIESAGAYFAPGGSLPSPMLNGHPTSDAEEVGTTEIPAALSGVVAMRRQLFCSLTGFDERYGNDLAEVELSLRAQARGRGRATLVTEARATIRPRMPKTFQRHPAASARLLMVDHDSAPSGSRHYLEAAGFAVAGHVEQPVADEGPVPAGPVSVQLPDLVRLSSGIHALPRLRWTIDTPVTAGWWAQIWGDWHFAHSLAKSLRRLGQHVSVDTRQARGRDSRRFDDVLLTLRGTEAVPTSGAPVNLMWVLYDSESVTAEEAGAYDRVFAASTTWATERRNEWGYPIEALLQCTDPDLFHPGRAESLPNNRALFVGNTRRGTPRPIVEAALAADVGLDLYGTGWEEFPAAREKLVARKVSNAELGRLYAEAGVVLNDHRDDMRRTGFISNRLFDAAACGARVLSDPIPGASELFAGSVQFCNADEVADWLAEPFGGRWPDTPQRLATAAMVRSEHSFDKRAEVLLARAVEILEGQAAPGSAPA